MLIAERPFHEWTCPDGTIWTQFYRTATGYLLRFPNLADFTISTDGKEVVAYRMHGVSDQTIDHLCLNQVQPLALSRQFKLVLHAAAIEIENFAVAFLGQSGQGKSTLAASFSAHGFRFLTDDGLLLKKGLQGYIIDPGHPSIRLWQDSRDALIPDTTKVAPPVAYTSKLRLLADTDVAHCDVARPLRCVYFLGGDNADSVSIEPVKGCDAVIELVKNSFLLDIEEREMLIHHFSQLTELAKIQPFYKLDYPRRYDALPLVRDAIIRHSTSLS